MAAQEQVVRLDRTGAARGVQLLADRDIAVAWPRQLGRVPGALLLHRGRAGQAGPRQHEAGEKGSDKAAGHDIVLRS